jgi:hypothetical protein
MFGRCCVENISALGGTRSIRLIAMLGVELMSGSWLGRGLAHTSDVMDGLKEAISSLN